MTWTRIGLTVTSVGAMLALMLAVSTVWLLLTDPSSIASGLEEGDVGPIARQLAAACMHALRGLLAYL